jgi:hypothetical protein
MRDSQDRYEARRATAADALKKFMDAAAASGQEVTAQDYYAQLDKLSGGSSWLRGQIDPGAMATLVTKLAAAWEAIDPNEYKAITGIRKDWDMNFKPSDPETIRIRESFKRVRDGT